MICAPDLLLDLILIADVKTEEFDLSGIYILRQYRAYCMENVYLLKLSIGVISIFKDKFA